MDRRRDKTLKYLETGAISRSSKIAQQILLRKIKEVTDCSDENNDNELHVSCNLNDSLTANNQ